ncbi:hypothetical protein [Aquipseudomonas campi]
MKKENAATATNLETEIANIRAELFKENLALHVELESLKNSSKELLYEVREKIEAAESKITEKAIDKTLGIIREIKTWISIASIFLLAIMGLGAHLGYKNLSDSLSTAFEKKVTKWMQFEDEEGEGRKTLDKLRTEAILNAYMIRISRSYSTGNSSSFSLTKGEESRLFEILQEPSTKFFEFSDALTIILKNRGPFHFDIPDDPMGGKLISLISSDNLSKHKQALVFEKLQNDQLLLPYARSIVNDKRYSVYTRISAFENIKTFAPEEALNFTKENFEESETELKKELAIFWAKETGEYNLIQQYLADLIKNKPEHWESGVASTLASLGDTLPSITSPKTEQLASFFTRGIELGTNIELTDGRFGPRHLALQLSGATSAISKPTTLFEDEKLISATINTKSLDLEWLTTAVDFFQIDDQGRLLTTVIMTPNITTEIVTKQKMLITGTVADGNIWLRTENFPGGKELTATWRDRSSGLVHTAQIESVKESVRSSYKLSFDKKLLETITYTYRSPEDYL